MGYLLDVFLIAAYGLVVLAALWLGIEAFLQVNYGPREESRDRAEAAAREAGPGEHGAKRPLTHYEEK